MKVCTDSCVFGAWTASKIAQLSPGKILDIGTGTGLLTLMIAQKSHATIHCVEVDEKAFLQAGENIKGSPWHDRVHAFNADIRNWKSRTKFDFIISNPPFYEKDLLPHEEDKKNSKHSSRLKLAELINAAENHLTKDGFFSVLLPFSRVKYFEAEALKSGLFVIEKLLLKQSARHSYFRGILMLQGRRRGPKEMELSIKQAEDDYSDDFKKLLKDYYLKL